MTFTIRYVVDYKKRRITKDQLFNRMLQEIDQTASRVAVAGAAIGIVEIHVIDVRISEKIKESKA